MKLSQIFTCTTFYAPRRPRDHYKVEHTTVLAPPAGSVTPTAGMIEVDDCFWYHNNNFKDYLPSDLSSVCIRTCCDARRALGAAAFLVVPLQDDDALGALPRHQQSTTNRHGICFFCTTL